MLALTPLTKWDDCCSAARVHIQVLGSDFPEIAEIGFLRSQLPDWRLLKLEALPVSAWLQEMSCFIQRSATIISSRLLPIGQCPLVFSLFRCSLSDTQMLLIQ